MSGFIYLWFDRKHKRFYLGKHWGTPDDGYDCSSRWMRGAKKRRPQDFKRRILEYVNDRNLLTDREEAWGSLIKNEELGKRYYNLRLPGGKQWHDNDDHRLSIGQKISKSLKGNQNRVGKTFTEESRAKISKTKKGVKNVNFTEESRKKVSEQMKEWNALHPGGLCNCQCKTCGKLFNPGNLKRHVCRSIELNYIEAALLG